MSLGRGLSDMLLDGGIEHRLVFLLKLCESLLKHILHLLHLRGEHALDLGHVGCGHWLAVLLLNVESR